MPVKTVGEKVVNLVDEKYTEIQKERLTQYLDNVIFDKFENYENINNMGIETQINKLNEVFMLKQVLTGIKHASGIDLVSATLFDINDYKDLGLELTLEIVGVEKEDELIETNYDDVEDSLVNETSEMFAITEDFNEAIELLNENGLSNIARSMTEVAKKSIANNWCHENM